MEKSLPKGWVETELGNIVQIVNGYAFKSTDYLDAGIPIIRMSDIENNRITVNKAARVSESTKYDNFIINKGDILIGLSGSIGKYGIFDLDEKVYLNQRVGNIRLISEKLTNKKFIYYYLGLIQSEILKSGYGGAVPNISAKDLDNFRILFPPLPEQERIVAKLDKLFAQHEKIKKALDRIPQLLKAFRQQVLTQAVTGKLTEQWREGKELEEWKMPTLKEVCFSFKYGSSSKSEEVGKVAVLRMGNLQNGRLDLSDLKYSNSKAEIEKYTLLPGDVLFNRTNSPELVGKTSIYKGEIPAIYAGYLIKIENNRDILDSDYLNFYMNTPQVKVWCNEVKSDGVSQSNINAKKLAELEISLPPLQEQQEIVRRVECLFAKADTIEARYLTLKAKIDSLPQSILHKAFKGELVPQLPTDGDAKDLLAEIMALKEEVKGRKKK